MNVAPWPLADLWQTAGVLLVYLVAGVVKGGLGFGLPLVSISVLPLLVPVDMALAVNAVVLPLTNVYQYGRSGLVVETLQRFWPVLAGLVVGVPLAAAYVTAIEPRDLALWLGVFVCAFAILTAAAPRLVIPPAAITPAGAVTGLAAGAVGALTTANGPVFVMYLVGLGIERRAMVAALGLFFLVSGILVAGSFWLIGLLDLARTILALACVGPAFAGMRLGDALARRVQAERFRGLVLAMLFLLGLNVIARAVLGG